MKSLPLYLVWAEFPRISHNGSNPTPLPWNLTLKIRRKQRREQALTILFKIKTAFPAIDVIPAQVYNKFY